MTAHKVNQGFVLKEPTHKEDTEANRAGIGKLSSRSGIWEFRPVSWYTAAGVFAIKGLG